MDRCVRQSPALCPRGTVLGSLFAGTFILLDAWSAPMDLQEGSFVKFVILPGQDLASLLHFYPKSLEAVLGSNGMDIF